MPKFNMGEGGKVNPMVFLIKTGRKRIDSPLLILDSSMKVM